jgi:hypothetical protein
LDIYIGILLGAHPIFYISRIRVKEQVEKKGEMEIGNK